MAKLEVFQNGNFNNGDPVFQIGSKNSDGGYDVTVFDLISQKEANAKLKSMSVKPAKEEPEEEATSKADLKGMTKVQLEDFARDFGVELDRREKKESLVKQAYKAQFDG